MNPIRQPSSHTAIESPRKICQLSHYGCKRHGRKSPEPKNVLRKIIIVSRDNVTVDKPKRTATNTLMVPVKHKQNMRFTSLHITSGSECSCVCETVFCITWTDNVSRTQSFLFVIDLLLADLLRIFCHISSPTRGKHTITLKQVPQQKNVHSVIRSL